MQNSYNQFYFTGFFCLLYIFRTNIAVRHQEHGIIYCITQYNRYNQAGESSWLTCTIVPNCVIQGDSKRWNQFLKSNLTKLSPSFRITLYSILCRAPDDERLDSFETCRADKKNCGIKIDYKNCASRWSLTHCTHPVAPWKCTVYQTYFTVILWKI